VERGTWLTLNGRGYEVLLLAHHCLLHWFNGWRACAGLRRFRAGTAGRRARRVEKVMPRRCLTCFFSRENYGLITSVVENGEHLNTFLHAAVATAGRRGFSRSCSQSYSGQTANNHEIDGWLFFISASRSAVILNFDERWYYFLQRRCWYQVLPVALSDHPRCSRHSVPLRSF
jgi:hypothetical protein